ncbi:MAG: hypothetical protein KDC98_25605 [Planctomycetes bacterium]|nr:hypothetical protein [Planctomycetota bacterium]
MGGFLAPEWWNDLWSWLDGNQALIWWSLIASIASLVLAIVLLPIVVVRLDADYFVAARSELRSQRTFGRWLLFVGRNLVGVLFVLVGFVLLFLPGQGLLMIFIGLLMVDLPGKRALELRIVRRPKILALLNGMRQKRGRAPFRID